MEIFNHLKKVYESDENVRKICEEVGITHEAVQGAPFTRPYGLMWFMHGLVRAGRDSDEDLLLLFGPNKSGDGLPKMVRECREEVRQLIVLPMLSGPGTPVNAMTTYYSKDFQSKPFKARPSDEQEVSKAKELLQMMKKVRQTMKESDSSVNLQIACKKCGNAAGKLQRCGGCMMVQYCSKECQIADWPDHKVQSFLQERQLIQTSPLHTLKGTRIGVEAAAWLRKLSIHEPFQVAMGGIPVTLLQQIGDEVNKFANHGIKPLFVFNGLNLVRKDKPFSALDQRVGRRTAGWEAYAKGDIKGAAAAFESSEKFSALTFLPNILKYFKENGIEYFRAPYLAWSQLAYFSAGKQNLVHGIYAGLELLLFGVSKLIIEIDFEKGTFDWVDYKAVLTHLALLPEQFVDACILAGFDQIMTFPPLLDNVQPFSFRSAVEMLRNFKTGYAAAQAYATNPAVSKVSYMDLFQRTKCLIRNHMIFDLNCVCEPLNKEFAPNDLHEIIGPRLPNEIYFLLSQGLINPQVANNLIGGSLVEAAPLVDSEEYRSFLSELLEIRTKALALLSSVLHDYYHMKKVVMIRWFEPSVEQDMPHHSKEVVQVVSSVLASRGVPSAKQAKDLTSLLSLMQLHVQRADASAPLISALEGLTVSGGGEGGGTEKNVLTSSSGGGTSSSSSSGVVFSTWEEGLVVVLEAGLQTQHYVTVDGGALVGKPTPYGRAFALCTTPEANEEALLLLELLRAKKLSGRKLGIIPPPPSSSSSLSSSTDNSSAESIERDVNLISRVLSVLPAKLGGVAWEGPVDQDLLAFQSLVKALHRSVRNLYEMVFCAQFVRHRIRLPPQDYSTLVAKLPFFDEHNTAVGIAMKSFLTTANGDLAKLTPLFPTYKAVVEDLRRGLTFWDSFYKMVSYLRDETHISAEVFFEFESANKLLAQKRKAFNK